MKKISALFIASLLISSIFFSACNCYAAAMEVTSIKTAIGIDEKLLPVKPISNFATGTAKVFCWFQWKKAELNTQIIARWYYLEGNIHVLDYTFSIPRKEGMGSVSLSMPPNKVLPSGEYRVDLTLENKLLKSVKFKIS